jgi:hypothetical protein
MRFYGAEYNNKYWTRLRLVQYCCTLLHKSSYWSRSSAVIVYYYIRLYFTVFLLTRSNTRDIPFSNILITLKNFFENFELLKKSFFKFYNFEILWNFLTYWLAKSNFCAIKKHIALSCHAISFIDFARECNMLFYCTEIVFC